MPKNSITAETPVVVNKDDTPRVMIRLPDPEESGSGMKVDPYEHVTINGELPVYVKRGEPVEVTVPVFLQLRNKYPNI